MKFHKLQTIRMLFGVNSLFSSSGDRKSLANSSAVRFFGRMYGDPEVLSGGGDWFQICPIGQGKRRSSVKSKHTPRVCRLKMPALNSK